ncbi:MAG: endonuclease MutS2, partial [Anaerolineae bacterium]
MDAKSLGVLEFDKVCRLVADHASFGGGRALALALTPASEVGEVRRRLALAAEAGLFLDRRGASPVAGAHDLRPEVEDAERGRCLLPAELLEIQATLVAARTARRSLLKERTRWPALAAVADGLDGCRALQDALGEALSDDGEVLDGASAKLRRLRKRKRIAHDRLTRRLQDLMAKPGFRDLLQEPLVTQRSGRYVVPVRSAYR